MKGCCGKIVTNRKHEKVKIPANPKINNGVGVIYLGSGIVKLSNNRSGNIYYASDHRRDLRVDRQDVDRLLNRSDIMLNPD